MNPTISLENISKHYYLYHNLVGFKTVIFRLHRLAREFKKNQVQVLNDVSFQAFPGEAIGIIGPNGAGKSTILSLIAGVIKPDMGKITVVGKISPLIELGAGFHSDLTGMDNIFLYGLLLGMRKHEVEAKCEDILEFSELSNHIQNPLRTYSSGMITRLGFSVAVHAAPDILLVDEVLSVGDESFKEKSMDKILELKKRGVTIVFVSHNLKTVQEVCDRVIWLEKGALVLCGDKVEDITQEYARKIKKA